MSLTLNEASKQSGFAKSSLSKAMVTAGYPPFASRKGSLPSTRPSWRVLWKPMPRPFAWSGGDTAKRTAGNGP